MRFCSHCTFAGVRGHHNTSNTKSKSNLRNYVKRCVYNCIANKLHGTPSEFEIWIVIFIEEKKTHKLKINFHRHWWRTYPKLYAYIRTDVFLLHLSHMWDQSKIGFHFLIVVQKSKLTVSTTILIFLLLFCFKDSFRHWLTVQTKLDINI